MMMPRMLECGMANHIGSIAAMQHENAEGEPRLAAAAAVGDGTQERREDSDA